MSTIYLASLLMLLLLAAPAAADESHLRTHLCSGNPSPLDRMSRGARLRLLETLQPTATGATASYQPLAVDLTPDEKAEIADLLDLHGYQDLPMIAPRAVSAGARSHDYPSAASPYCAQQETLQDWARRARLRDEGELSAAIATLYERIDVARSGSASFVSAAIAITAAAAPVVQRVDAGAWADDLDTWVLRDLNGGLAAAARYSEDLPTIDAAIRVREFALRTQAVESEGVEALAVLRTAVANRVPGARRIGRTTAFGKMRLHALPETPRFVFVASTTCPFSRDALTRIAQDPALSDRFAEQVLILAPYREFTSALGAPRWNAQHPELAFNAWILHSEWPELELGRFPAFYALDESGATLVMDGFPAEEAAERLDRIRTALATADSTDTPPEPWSSTHP